MNKPFQAIFEGGVLRPLEPLSLGEHEVVTLTVAQERRKGAPSIEESLDDDMIDHDALAVSEREGANAVAIEELREMLKCIPGSMSDAIISERGDY
jgi:predicted DNA-binding antitoxin AbrB/MazE fold protein